MKKIVFKDDPNEYTVAELGLIFKSNEAYKEQELAAQEFYNSVNLDENQTDILNNYIASRLDAESAIIRFFKGYGGGDDLKQSGEKADKAKQELLKAAALDENQLSLFKNFSELLGHSQHMYLDCIFKGINPMHLDKVPMLSIGEVLKRLRAKERMTQADMAKTLCISQNHMGAIEAGREKPSKILLRLIFHEFDVSFEYLLAAREV